jgi:hypothetical protein
MSRKTEIPPAIPGDAHKDNGWKTMTLSWAAKARGSRSSARNGRFISNRANSSFFPEGFHLVLIQADNLESELKPGQLILGLTSLFLDAKNSVCIRIPENWLDKFAASPTG